MSDTLTTQSATPATIPADSVIATDDCGAAGHTQIVKLSVAADGSATPATVLPVSDNSGSLTVDAPVATPVFVRLSDGSAAIATLPVSVATIPSHAVTNAGTFAVQDSAAETSVASIDTKTPALGQALAAASVPVVLTAAQVTTLTPPATITGFATSAKQDTLQTAIDAIKTAAEILDNTVAGSEMQVDVLTLPNVTIGAAIPAGTNAIGKLAANSGVDIGDVDVTSCALPTGAATSALQGGGLPAALGAQGALKVEGVASGTAIPVSGTFWQATQPVSGTVTATVAAKAILHQNAAVSRSTVLTTQLDGLADGAFSAVGSEIDNSVNLDKYGMIEVNLASLNPTAGAFIELYMTTALDGTNYEDPPSATNPGIQNLIARMSVATGSAAKRIRSPRFELPPCKVKFVLYNDCNVSLGANSSTATLYSMNDEIQ